MKVTLGKYRNNIPFIKAMLDRELDKRNEVTKVISQISVACGVPVIVVTYYVGEMLGFTPEINESIAKLKEFYQYTEIVE